MPLPRRLVNFEELELVVESRTMSKPRTLSRSRSTRIQPEESVVESHKGSSLEITIPPSEELERNLRSDEIIIGLALGSPGRNPLHCLPMTDRDIDLTTDSAIPESNQCRLRTSDEISLDPKDVQRKGSKWKSLGGLLGRKDSRASPVHSLGQTIGPKLPGEQISGHSETAFLRRKRADSSRSKAGTDSAQFPDTTENQSSLKRHDSRRKGLRRRLVEQTRPETSRFHDTMSPSPDIRNPQPPPAEPQRPIASLLQIEIPNIELDRYSVMFGDLLSRSPARQQDLMVARQNHMNRLDTQAASENELGTSSVCLQKPSHNRGDSASSKSSKTPSFSLFPSSHRQSATSVVNKPLPKPSPLGRATTAPNTLAPSIRPRLEKSKSENNDRLIVIVHGTEDLPSSTTPDVGMHSIDNPGDSNDGPESRLPPSTSSDVKEVCRSRDFPARKSSMKRSTQPVRGTRGSDHSPDNVVNVAAEVSIARQISISRRQRQLLVPIAPKLARQPRQPTLVDAESTLVARKSHHLTLEGA